MKKLPISLLTLVFVSIALPGQVLGQGMDPEALLAPQREAMKRFDMMDGVWRGTAQIMMPTGEWQELTQTERVGAFLDGSVKVIEGRGYEEDGSLSFNALGVISYDPQEDAYTMRSYAQGRNGDFPITPTEEGYVWEIPAGPAIIRYTASIDGGTWTEIGDRVAEGQKPMRFIKLELRRVGDTSWPGGDPVLPE